MSTVQKVVLIPRYSSYIAAGADAIYYRSAPINVRDFAKADVTLWRSLFETPSVFTFYLEESVDLLLWETNEDSEISGAANEERSFACDLEFPWVRSVVKLQYIEGEHAGVTCWVVGNFTLRDR